MLTKKFFQNESIKQKVQKLTLYTIEPLQESTTVKILGTKFEKCNYKPKFDEVSKIAGYYRIRGQFNSPVEKVLKQDDNFSELYSITDPKLYTSHFELRVLFRKLIVIKHNVR